MTSLKAKVPGGAWAGRPMHLTNLASWLRRETPTRATPLPKCGGAPARGVKKNLTKFGVTSRRRGNRPSDATCGARLELRRCTHLATRVELTDAPSRLRFDGPGTRRKWTITNMHFGAWVASTRVTKVQRRMGFLQTGVFSHAEGHRKNGTCPFAQYIERSEQSQSTSSVVFTTNLVQKTT